MKRFPSLLAVTAVTGVTAVTALIALLLLSMGIGACSSKSLGSVDAGVTCDYQGKTYALGATFPAGDGCNTCTCGTNGQTGWVVACMLKACPNTDAGLTEGGMADGPISTSDGGVASCTYNGKTYAAGADFTATDGCNTCSCDSGGLARCTQRACASDGGIIDGAAITGVCSFGQDQTCNEDQTVSALRGKCQADGSCVCGANGTSRAASPYSGRCLAPDNITGEGCEFGGKLHPVGAIFPFENPCDTATCTKSGQVTPATSIAACPDASAKNACGIDDIYAYGNVGGRAAYQDQVRLIPSTAAPATAAAYNLSRTFADNSTVRACGSQLPSCGDPAAIDLSDVMADVLDPVVQKYLSQGTSTTSTPSLLLGLDTRSIGGPIFSFQRGDAHGFLVGAACNGAAGCVDVPAAVANLVADLRALDQQQLSAPSCAGVAPTTFACGKSAMCIAHAEYCALATINGTQAGATCRLYPTGCTTCDCARQDAAAVLGQIAVCFTPSAYQCTYAGTAVPETSSSPALVVSCASSA